MLFLYCKQESQALDVSTMALRDRRDLVPEIMATFPVLESFLQSALFHWICQFCVVNRHLNTPQSKLTLEEFSFGMFAVSGSGFRVSLDMPRVAGSSRVVCSHFRYHNGSGQHPKLCKPSQSPPACSAAGRVCW